MVTDNSVSQDGSKSSMKSSAAEYFNSLSPLKELSRKSGVKMYEGSMQNGRSGRCHCCPYGYHIDLDFVRFCQSLSQGAKNDTPALMQLKKLKKQRRRQTKSIEVMLGISPSNSSSTVIGSESSDKPLTGKAAYAMNRKATPIPPPRDKKRLFTPPSPPPRKQSLTHPALQSPPPDIINSSKFMLSRSEEAADALQEAVLDFEEALESSRDHHRGRRSNAGLSNVDLLHHTYSSPSKAPAKNIVGRSNSLPRQFSNEPLSGVYSRQNCYTRDWNGNSPYSYNYSNYSSSNQSTLMADAMAALNAARGFPSNQTQDFDTLSMASGMSGVSTSTLQSIREQMATGLSRLKELEKEVHIIPSLEAKLKILKEEKRILLEHLRSVCPNEDLPLPHIDLDGGEISDDDLEGKLSLLRRYSTDKSHYKLQRKRSLSPMRVHLEDFRSYRRARAGSVSEGSDTESVHSYRGREHSRDRPDTRLHISESNDYEERRHSRTSSVPSTPIFVRKGSRDAAVNCKVLTRDVGTSHLGPRVRSIGIMTEKVPDLSKDNDKKKEIKPKPCMLCFRRNQMTYESRGVGTTSPKQDSGRLSMSSVSSESIDPEEIELKIVPDASPKNSLLQKLGKKSPIISRLSEPQLFPPTLTFDNATNTEPVCLRDQRTNTTIFMDNFFTKEQLNESIREAKKQWEATHKNKLSATLQDIKKPPMRDCAVQTPIETPVSKPRVSVHSTGVQVKQIMKDCAVSVIPEKVIVKTRSIGIGDCTIKEEKQTKPKSKSVGTGEFRLTDIWCNDCLVRKMKPMRSVGCSSDRITDPINKPVAVQSRTVGVGDGRITDITCKNCKSKYTRNASCQVKPITHSVLIEAKLPSPKEPKEIIPATTPEAERRSFGSSGVRICDKCHEAITSVAKDIVHTSSGTIIPPAVPSKIPRLMDAQKADSKTVDQRPPESKAHIVDTRPAHQIPTVGISSREKSPLGSQTAKAHSRPVKSEQPVDNVSLAPVKSFVKEDGAATATSVTSSSQPSIGSSPQVKRAPYTRQETYTKSAEGFVNLAFEEIAEAPKKKSPSVPQKPKLGSPHRKSPIREERSSEREQTTPIRDKTKEKSSDSATSSSSSSSSEESGDEVSLAESSIAPSLPSTTLSLQSSSVFQPGDEKEHKKLHPSRETKAALKVLNDSIGKPKRSGQQLTNAINIIQKDWFKISSQKDANPHSVEDYMDAFEDFSKGLLHRVVNLADVNGNTAMHYAVSHGNFDVVSVLLDSKVCNINQQNKAGYTAIMLVALAQIRTQIHSGVVSKLFQLGDVNIKACQHGQTALMLAVSHGRVDMVRLLILSGADVNIQDEDGSTALMCAAEHGHLAIVRYLASQPDTDLYLMDNDGSTALTIAVEAGHKDVGVLLYKQMNLSKGGSSPYSSMRSKRPRTPTSMRSAGTPPPRNSAPVSPGRSRMSSGRASPANPRRSSNSLSNLIL